MVSSETAWLEHNQRFLTAAVAEVRTRLERFGEGGATRDCATGVDTESRPAPDHSESVDPVPAVEVLVRSFGLSSFERDILLLCAGMELDSSFGGLCAVAQGNPARPYPTFSLALAALPNPHWSALSPMAPLRRNRFIEIAGHASLTTNQLAIDERILHFLTGIQYLDDRLGAVLRAVEPPEEIAPSHAAQARSIYSTWKRSQRPMPVVEFCGPDGITKRAVAAFACVEIGLGMYSLAADQIPTNPSDAEGFLRLWERESLLTSSALYIDAEGIDMQDVKALAQISRFLEAVQGPVILSSRDPWRPLNRGLKTVEIGKPTAKEQERAWQNALKSGNADVNGHVSTLVGQFNLNIAAIRATVDEALESGDGDSLERALWEGGRSQARARLDGLAQRIEAVAQWDDLVLPPPERELLREISSHVLHRSTVYEAWGFGRISKRGLGISAMFAGSSGTGKTMAAEVLANALHLDLYRIDLSSVISKYIGETEKNLRRVFDAAEDGGAILFFDEADALFGKRSEVKDSHDRYANIEINYLLQRVESYRGLAVLATNMRSALDPAFLRRIRFVVNFPFPDFGYREQIWQRVFPASTPVESLNTGLLARLAIPGGNIRNIAMNAAFRAAEEGSPVRMKHLAQAARHEFVKMEKPIPETEIADWDAVAQLNEEYRAHA
jgi:hypothetical protein